MRILIAGAGAVGGFLGGNLARAGRDVTFLVRPAHEESLRESGLLIRAADGTETRLAPRTVTAESLTGPYDVVLLSVRATALGRAIADLAPGVGEHSMILPLLNGMAHVGVLREAFGAGRVVGGVCELAAERGVDGTITQLSPAVHLTYGEFNGSETDRMHALGAALSGAGFDTELSTAIERDMWAKWFMMAAAGALTTLLRGTPGDIVAVPGGLETARGILDECAAVVEASGFPLPRAVVDRVTDLLTQPGSPFTTSLYRDVVAGRPVEADQIVCDLAARGTHLGVAVPLLSLACTGLKVYERALEAAAA